MSIRERILTDVEGNRILHFDLKGKEYLFDEMLSILEEVGYVVTNVDKENNIIEARSK